MILSKISVNIREGKVNNTLLGSYSCHRTARGTKPFL